MVLERDYPLSRWQVRVLAICLVASAIFGVLLFGGYLPGFKPNLSAVPTTTLEGEQYYVTTSGLPLVGLSKWSTPWNVTFENVTFGFQVENWNLANGRIVFGNGTEANGTRYGFVLGVADANGTRTSLFLSPDQEFGVSWYGGWFSQLVLTIYVRVPAPIAGASPAP